MAALCLQRRWLLVAASIISVALFAADVPLLGAQIRPVPIPKPPAPRPERPFPDPGGGAPSPARPAQPAEPPDVSPAPPPPDYAEFADVDKIPRNYKTWVLFLPCSPGWPPPGPNPEIVIEQFRIQFERFGRSIGREQLAVWLGNGAKQLNVETIARLCRKFGLTLSRGPYVIATRQFPDVDGVAQLAFDAKIEFPRAQPDRIGEVLGKLADGLIGGGPPPENGDTFRTWLSASFETLQEGVRSILRGVKITVKSPAGEIEIGARG